MKHLGDITKINGHEVPNVHILVGGSPCQDLSVAGKRAGLQGERSGLFMEQVRIFKEMRDEYIRRTIQQCGSVDDLRRIFPRYFLWENVVGALSSGTPKGEDFRIVLEEVCRIADKTATVPMPDKGKWSTSGCIMGDRWSVAWRVHDLQFWGCPQRRKRIALVADFGARTAPDILFEKISSIAESVYGDSEQGREKGKTVAGDASTGTYPSSFTLKIRGGC